MSVKNNVKNALLANKAYTDKKFLEATAEGVTIQQVTDMIAADNLSEQKIKPAVSTFAQLPSITGTEQGINWLCTVTGEGKIYQRVAGTSSSWVFYSDLGDFVTPASLTTAVNNHNTSGSAHADLRTLIAARGDVFESSLAADIDNAVSEFRAENGLV